MPTLRDVTVHVTDASRVELQEWGTQTLRGHNKVSTYIKSEADMSFQIMIQPKIPYVASDVASAHAYETRMRGTERPGFFKMEDEWEDIDDDYSSPGATHKTHKYYLSCHCHKLNINSNKSSESSRYIALEQQ